MFRPLFRCLGIVAFASADPDVSLILIGFWRRFVVAISPANLWISIDRCERRTQQEEK